MAVDLNVEWAFLSLTDLYPNLWTYSIGALFLVHLRLRLQQHLVHFANSSTISQRVTAVQ